MKSDLPVKPTTVSYERTLSAATAKPVDRDVTVRFEADASRVGTSARPIIRRTEMLPEWLLRDYAPEATIPAGGVRSSEVTIRFCAAGRTGCEKGKSYVLPVTIRSEEVETLASGRTYYYLLQEEPSSMWW